jgi:hypothetical protein
MSGTPEYDGTYQRLPGLVLGFHGCDEEVGESLLRGEIQHLEHSANKYDWLGNGLYFWENDPLRAWEFAQAQHSKPHTSKGHVKKPFVVGAVIDLGHCLNLTDRTALNELTQAFEFLQSSYASVGEALPINSGTNMGARFLDRAVIEMVHGLRDTLNTQRIATNAPGLPSYDSVRSPFPEGDELYAGAGFRAHNHIQIAIRNNACIKGYFRPLTQSRPF